MKITNSNILLAKGEFSSSDEFNTIISELGDAIKLVTWGKTDKFVINPTTKGNGVVPIKINFINYLKSKGWQTEQMISCADGVNPGPIDVIKKTSYGIFAVEWETGNISSSHRALNKIAVGILEKQLIGGILILPQRSLARYLTDRIGNYEEIAPYFKLYSHLSIENGVIGAIGIEADEIDPEVLIIPKGKDGNAKKQFKSSISIITEH